MVRLLEVDPDLGGELSSEQFAEVLHHLVLPSVQLEAGPWTPDTLGIARGVKGRVAGFLLVNGSVTVDVTISTHVCTRLLTPR